MDDLVTNNVDELMSLMAEKAKGVFSLCDIENKGFITKKDMLRLQVELPLTVDQLSDVFDSLDIHNRNYLTLNEFTNGFGSFLGLPSRPPATQTLGLLQFHQRRQERLESEGENEDKLEEDDDDDHDGQFDQLIKGFGACGLLEDIKVIKSLWLRLNRNQPEMLNNFEEFLRKITSLLKTTHMDYKALQTAVENNKIAHNEEIQQLYLEMESQINEEKARIRSEEIEKELLMRRQLEGELEDRDRRLQELMSQQKQMEISMAEMNKDKLRTLKENEILLQEKEMMEKDYDSSKDTLEKTKAQILELKSAKLEHVTKQDEKQLIAGEISDWIALERKNLLKQINNLREKNKNLMDIQDEFQNKWLSPRRYPKISEDNCHTLYDSTAETNASQSEDRIPNSDSSCSDFTDETDKRRPERIYKIVFVGDSDVGKTTFIHRVCNKRYLPSFTSTIGVDFRVCYVKVDEQVIALQLWDTAGQERFRSFSKQYFRKADGIIMVYDVTEPSSFRNIKRWFADIQSYTEEIAALMLIGTKADQDNEEEEVGEVPVFRNINSSARLRSEDDGKDGKDTFHPTRVDPVEARKLAIDCNAAFFETSSLTGLNIKESIKYMARLLRDREDFDIARTLTLTKSPSIVTLFRKKKCCN